MDAKGFLITGLERWEDAQKLNSGEDKRLFETCYIAGYTVECILKYIIMKKCGLRNYNEVNKLLEYTQEEKNSISDGTGVIWFGKTIYEEKALKTEKTFLKALTKHDIRILINSAVHFNALDATTRTMINRSASDCYKWDSQWRYGKTYLLESRFLNEYEEITKEKTVDFLAQIYWLINEIRTFSGHIEINIASLRGE